MPTGVSRKRSSVFTRFWLGMIMEQVCLSICVGSARRDGQSDDELLFWLSSAGCLLPLLEPSSAINV